MRCPWRVAALEVLPGYRLRVIFADGLSGIVDLSEEAFEGVFAPLADPEYFARAEVRDGAVTWPHGLDLAPDAMHAEVKRRGSEAA